MDIKQFGAQIKSKYPAYKDYSDEEIGKRMLEKYPVYKDRVKVQDKNILQKVGEFVAPATTRNLTELPARLEAKRRTLPNAKGNLIQAIKNAGVLTGDFAKGIFSPEQLTEVALTAAVPGGAKLAGKAATTVAHPKRTVGQAIEKKAEQAGVVPNELLEKIFGTFSRPNEKIIEGVGTARDRGKLLQKLKAEIVTQGRGAGGVVPGTTYKKILEYRKGAGQAGKFGSNATGEDILLNRRLQQAYSDILKEGAGTGNLDRIFSLLSGIEGRKKTIGAAAGGVIIYSLLQNLVNKVAARN